MEEKIICMSDDIKKPGKGWLVLAWIALICVVVAAVTGIVTIISKQTASTFFDEHYVWDGTVRKNYFGGGTYYPHEWVSRSAEKEYSSLHDTYIAWNTFHIYIAYISISLLALAFIRYLFYFYCRESKIIVTDKRVYGKTIGNKQVDLPLDSITAVGMSGKRRIVVSTPSGSLRFYLQSRRDEIKQAITDLLIARQESSERQVFSGLRKH